MAKIKSLRRFDEMDFGPPVDCSYFEEMCWRAENESDPENRGHAQFEVDRMVSEMNDAKEAESALNKIDVQCLIDHVNESIGQAMQPLYFEPNDVVTQVALAATIEGMMKSLHEMHIVYDYKVICDASNNPPSVVDQGLLNVDVYMKTVKAVDPVHVRGTGGISPISAVTDPSVTGKKVSNNSNPVYGANANVNSGGYININAGSTISSGVIGNMTGQLTGAQYSFSASGQAVTLAPQEQKQTADLPSITWYCQDENGAMIRLELKPEGTIGAHEALQLSMLIHASNSSPLSFSPYLYIKKHNLERHFKFST